MTKEEFDNDFNTHYNEIAMLIDAMPNKGNTCAESQRICIVIALREVEHAVNGLEEEDFEDED